LEGVFDGRNTEVVLNSFLLLLSRVGSLLVLESLIHVIGRRRIRCRVSGRGLSVATRTTGLALTRSASSFLRVEVPTACVTRTGTTSGSVTTIATVIVSTLAYVRRMRLCATLLLAACCLVRKVAHFISNAHALQQIVEALHLLLVAGEKSIFTVNLHLACGQHFSLFDLGATQLDRWLVRVASLASLISSLSVDI
jgi:hypothetical protein